MMLLDTQPGQAPLDSWHLASLFSFPLLPGLEDPETGGGSLWHCFQACGDGGEGAGGIQDVIRAPDPASRVGGSRT